MSKNNNDETRKRIFYLLKKANIPQKEFAEKLGVSAVTITDWKTGKSASFSKMTNEIADVLGVKASELLGEKKSGPGVIIDFETALDRKITSQLAQLTPEELAKVDAFVQGLLASR